MDRFNPRKPTKIFVKVTKNQWSMFAYNLRFKKYVWEKFYSDAQMFKKVNETTHVVKLYNKVNDKYKRIYVKG